jgi:hypothetical protein
MMIRKVLLCAALAATAAGSPAAAQTAYEICGSISAGAKRLACFQKYGDPAGFYTAACSEVAYHSGTGGLSRPPDARISLVLGICAGSPEKATCETAAQIIAEDKLPKNILVCNGGG